MEQNRLEDAFQWFLTEKQGENVSPATLSFYHHQLAPFLGWLDREQVRDFDSLTANHLRSYRVYQQGREKRYGGKLSGQSLVTSARAVRIFLNWARENNPGVAFDPVLFRLKRPRAEHKDATVFDISQLRQILSVCQTDTERMVVCLAVGAGLRLSEILGFALTAPDGESNLINDPYEKSRYLLRVRWDAGSKGRKTRHVPIPAKLAVRIKRYVAQAPHGSTLILNRSGRPLTVGGLQALLSRLEKRAGFHIHAHAFRHTFACVSVQQDVNFDKLRVAMGHADYDSLLTYVRLAAGRNLGGAKEWSEYLYVPSHRLL